MGQKHQTGKILAKLSFKLLELSARTVPRSPENDDEIPYTGVRKDMGGTNCVGASLTGGAMVSSPTLDASVGTGETVAVIVIVGCVGRAVKSGGTVGSA